MAQHEFNITTLSEKVQGYAERRTRTRRTLNTRDRPASRWVSRAINTPTLMIQAA